MAQLEFQINGNASGLVNAAKQGIGILGSLKQVADGVKIRLFEAKTEKELNNLGSVLTNVNARISELTNNALRNNQAFKDQQAAITLQNLSQKLDAATASASLFGTSIKTQQAEINAYQTALNKLLSLGIGPLDNRVLRLKATIDTLNASLASQQGLAALQAQYGQTGSLIEDLRRKIENLKTATSKATDERSIAQYNVRLKEAQAELARLNGLASGFTNTASLIGRAEKKVNDLKAALRTATNERALVSYNSQLVVAQRELDRLRTLGLSVADANRRMGAGFNTVGLEFGRIIQDAPYVANNFGSIGNNITRLVELVPGYITQTRAVIVANGGAATSANVLKTALAGIFTGWGAVTIAISAVVTAYTIYSMRSKKAEKDTVSFIETLRGLARAQNDAGKAAQSEQVRLDLLYRTYTNATLPLAQRKSAYDQLNQIYPEMFKNFSTEAEALANAKRAYDRLTISIRANAEARAAENVLIKNAERRIDNLTLERKALSDLAKINRDLAAAERQRDVVSRSGAGGDSELISTNKIASIEARREAVLRRINNIRTDNNLTAKQDEQLEKAVNDAIAKGGRLLDEQKTKRSSGTSELQKQLTIAEQLRNIRQRTENSVSLSGLDGYEADVQKVNNAYKDLQADLSAIANRIIADTKLSASARAKSLQEIAAISNQALINRDKELSALRITEEERVVSEIARIRGEAGIKTEELRSKELAQIDKWYTQEVEKAKGNEAILATIREGRTAQIDTVNQKYIDKETELRDKINQIREQAQGQIGGSETAQTQRIIAEWEKRRKAAIEYFRTLRKLIATDPSKTGAEKASEIAGLDAAQAQVEKEIKAAVKVDIDSKETDKIARELNQALRSATRSFASNFYQTLTSLNQEADRTFGAIFSKLAASLSQSMESVFQSIATKFLSDKLKEGVSKGTDGLGGKLSEEMQAGLAAAGLLGGAISGATNKTSYVGQAAGGAISGAATGALIGSAIPGIGTLVGGVVGGLIGGIGGLFGAGKARKEERKLQEQQLAEAKRQTELLRQQALAYTSSIIGKMTENGVITQVEINGFGELTAKVSGKDLQFVLDRNASTR